MTPPELFPFCFVTIPYRRNSTETHQASRASIVAENLPHNAKVKGSNPARKMTGKRYSASANMSVVYFTSVKKFN